MFKGVLESRHIADTIGVHFGEKLVLIRRQNKYSERQKLTNKTYMKLVVIPVDCRRVAELDFHNNIILEEISLMARLLAQDWVWHPAAHTLKFDRQETVVRRLISNLLSASGSSYDPARPPGNGCDDAEYLLHSRQLRGQPFATKEIVCFILQTLALFHLHRALVATSLPQIRLAGQETSAPSYHRNLSLDTGQISDDR
jgi:hypothetical protein